MKTYPFNFRWLDTNITACYSIQRPALLLGNTLGCQGFSSSRTSMEQNQKAIPFVRNQVRLNTWLLPMCRNSSLDELFCL